MSPKAPLVYLWDTCQLGFHVLTVAWDQKQPLLPCSQMLCVPGLGNRAISESGHLSMSGCHHPFSRELACWWCS